MAEVSENMKRMLLVANKATKCIQSLRAFEAGNAPSIAGVEIPLTQEESDELKSVFAADRTAGIAAWEAVVDPE
jgi:hypothetical protein